MTASAVALMLTAAPSAGATTNAATLYRQAIASTKAWTVHYVSSGVDAKVTVVESGDAGPASGSQQVAVGTGATADDASLIVIGQITYIKGNALALQNLMGLSATQAATDMGQWILFATSNPAFSQVVAGIRSSDVAQELALQGPFRLGASRELDGYRVDAIHGTQHVKGVKTMLAVLYVRASGRHQPVEEDTVTTQGKPNGVDHIVFSRWGELVRPRAPVAAITLGPIHAI